MASRQSVRWKLEGEGVQGGIYIMFMHNTVERKYDLSNSEGEM